MTISDTPTINIDIWSDVVCPWCYIGKRKFESAVANLGDEIHVKSPGAYQLDRPLHLENEPVRGVYERKFGGPSKPTAFSLT